MEYTTTKRDLVFSSFEHAVSPIEWVITQQLVLSSQITHSPW